MKNEIEKEVNIDKGSENEREGNVKGRNTVVAEKDGLTRDGDDWNGRNEQQGGVTDTGPSAAVVSNEL